MRLLQILEPIFLAAMLAFTAGLFAYLYRKNKKGEKLNLGRLFVPCVLFWGVLYSLIFIPFSAPDEYAHFASAYRLSNQLMLKEAVNDEGQVLVREEDGRLLAQELNLDSYDEVYGSFFALDQSEGEIGYGHAPMDVSAHAYLPQAIGITLGRLLSLGQVLTIYLGRLCNLAFFILCGYLAIRLAPCCKMGFFGAAMLPMTLELVSSLSYDGFAISLGFLFTAYVMHLIYRAPKVGGRELAVLALLLALLAPCKMVYIPMALLCFLIPREKFGSKKGFLLAAAAVAAAMAAAVLFVNFDKLLSYLEGTGGPVEWAGGASGYSFSLVLSHPVQVIGIFLNTLLRRLPEYIYGMLGGSLGWLQYETDGVLILFALAWTALTALPVRGEGEEAARLSGADAALPAEMASKADLTVLPVRHRVISLAVCLLVVIATMLIMLMSWTPLGSPVIEGVQGRYFLPVLPLGLAALRSRRLVLEKSVDGILLGGYCIVNLLVLQGIVGRM